MYSVWTKHAKDEEDKIQIEKSIRHSKWILDLQNEILKDVENSLTRQEVSPKSYNSPNWAYRQAHSNGFKQCLQLVKRINNLDQKETNIDDRSITTNRSDPSD